MLEEFNPWWIGEEDKDILEFKSLEYKHYPAWIKKISLVPFSLNFIFGLRKTGKTTGIKLLIDGLLKKIKNPFSIFFFRVDILDNYRELYEILKEYWKLRESKGLKNCYIFLDEVTLLENWWRAVKVFIDQYKPKAVFVLSGSVSMFFHGKAETFAGRRGKGKLINVMPLSFPEYFKLFKKPRLPATLAEIFKNYLKTGGYLGVLNKTIEEEDIILGLKNDLRIANKSVEIAKHIMADIFKKAPSPCSFHSIANDVGVSVKTVIEYLETLKEMFVLKDILYMSLDGRVYPRKERKLMVRDPFLTNAISIWTRCEIRKDFLYEWIVQEHLLRKYGEVYYYRDRYEIDCLTDRLKIEVKAGKPHRKYPKNVIILKEKNIPEFLFSL